MANIEFTKTHLLKIMINTKKMNLFKIFHYGDNQDQHGGMQLRRINFPYLKGIILI